jgi:hypothetical protein
VFITAQAALMEVTATLLGPGDCSSLVQEAVAVNEEVSSGGVAWVHCPVAFLPDASGQRRFVARQAFIGSGFRVGPVHWVLRCSGLLVNGVAHAYD